MPTAANAGYYARIVRERTILRRLVEVGRAAGCSYAQLVQRAEDIDWRALEGVSAVGLTAGASAPEELVDYFSSLGGIPEPAEQTVRGYKVRTVQQPLGLEDADARRKAIASVIARSLGKRRDG